MKSNIYTLRDSVVADHSLPFYAVNDAHAKRICADLIVAGDTPPATHPADFELFIIGDFDNQTGELKSCVPMSLGRLDQLC